MRSCWFVLGFVFIVVCMAGMTTRAEVVYSNLGAGDSFHPIESFWISGPATAVGTPPMLVGNFDLAAPFVVSGSQDFRFDAAELPLSRSAGNNSLVVRLLADGGGVPGSELASRTIGGIPDSGSPALVTADFSTAGIRLEAGLRYWLAADTETDASMLWHANTTGDRDFPQQDRRLGIVRGVDLRRPSLPDQRNDRAGAGGGGDGGAVSGRSWVSPRAIAHVERRGREPIARQASLKKRRLPSIAFNKLPKNDRYFCRASARRIAA